MSLAISCVYINCLAGFLASASLLFPFVRMRGHSMPVEIDNETSPSHLDKVCLGGDTSHTVWEGPLVIIQSYNSPSPRFDRAGKWIFHQYSATWDPGQESPAPGRETQPQIYPRMLVRCRSTHIWSFVLAGTAGVLAEILFSKSHHAARRRTRREAHVRSSAPVFPAFPGCWGGGLQERAGGIAECRQQDCRLLVSRHERF